MRLFLVLIVIFTYGSLNAQLFSEVSDSVGMNYRYEGNSYQVMGGGVLVIDVNNDGWEDVFQCSGIFHSKLWLNNKGEFEDVTAKYGLDTILNRFYDQAAISADYDNDGFVDFIVLNHGEAFGRGDGKSPILLHNINGERFERVPLDDLLAPAFYSSGTWGDFNNDGFADLYLTNYLASMGGNFDQSIQDSTRYVPICYPNKLLINQGGKGFKECSEEYGLADDGCSLASLFTDFDSDGDVDLMLLNDFGAWNNKGNRLFRNNYPEDSFTDISDSVGFNQKMYGMSIGPADLNFDGKLDYYLTNIGSNYMLMNAENQFEDRASSLGVQLGSEKDSITGTSWSGLFFDYEFDGDLDLYIAKGHAFALLPKTAVKDPNVFFINNDGKLEDKSDVSGINDLLSHRGAVVFDYDRDGDLDVVSSSLKLPLASFVGLDQKMKVYQNNSNAGKSVQIKLVGSDGVNKDCFGCQAVFTHHGKTSIFEVDNGHGHSSQGTRYIYFGLNNDKKLTELMAIFPNGKKFVFRNLSHKRIYSIYSDGTISSIKRKK